MNWDSCNIRRGTLGLCTPDDYIIDIWVPSIVAQNLVCRKDGNISGILYFHISFHQIDISVKDEIDIKINIIKLIMIKLEEHVIVI